MKTLSICVYGASSDKIADQYINAAYALGQEIGRHGDTLVFGGGATGVMGGASRGTLAEGGHVIGVVPRFMGKFELLNENSGQIIWVDTMEERKRIMEEKSDAFVIGPGGIGTMDEFFQVLTMNALERFNKPVVLYNIDGYYDDLIRFMVKSREEEFIKMDLSQIVYVCGDPKELIDHLHTLL